MPPTLRVGGAGGATAGCGGAEEAHLTRLLERGSGDREQFHAAGEKAGGVADVDRGLLHVHTHGHAHVLRMCMHVCMCIARACACVCAGSAAPPLHINVPGTARRL